MNKKVSFYLLILAFALSTIISGGCGGGTSVEVAGDAMMPTLNRGDKVLLDEASKDFARGDVIVFGDPKNVRKLLILRIVGMPGERIEVKENKTYINGTLLDEPYLQPIRNQFIQSFPETVIPDGRYYVMGDNRDSSSDSRHWGTIGKDLIKGKVTPSSSQGK